MKANACRASAGRLALALFVFLGMAMGTGWSATMTATVDRNTVPVGESITLTLSFEGVNANSPPTLPSIPNFRTGPATGYRSEISIINGRQSIKHVFDYSLVATQQGDVTIPAITGQAGGQPFSSAPIAVKVVAAGTPAAAAGQASAAGNLAFIRLIVPRTEVYLGEPFPVEIQLYFRNASDIRMPQLRADGFAIGQMPEPAQSRTQVGNVVYNLAVFRLSARAARTGELNLGPAEESLSLFTRADFFNRPLDPRPVVLTSETTAMRVLPLPKDGAPEGFNGTIGSYDLNVTAGPTSLAVGDPITVRVRISGNGPMDALTYPTQDWRDFNFYPPTSKLESSDSLGLSGAKSFEQVVIPQNHEIKSLPPFKFSFFDPQVKKYRTLTGPVIPLTIRPGVGSSTPPPVLTNSNAGNTGPREDDIIHIRPHLELATTAAPLLTRPVFLLLQALPLTLWIGLLWRRKRRESLANNPRRRRQREVAQRIRQGLHQLESHSSAGQSDEFFALLFRLLQEQLGERLDLPSSAITESIIEERLRGRKVPPDTLKALQELFLSCNQARYAPVRDRQELAAYIPRLDAVLQELQAMPA